MTQKTVKPPTNKSEEQELQKALFTYQISRLEAARKLLESENLTAFLAEVNALIEEGLPIGSAVLNHLNQLPAFFEGARAGVASDISVRGGGPSPVIEGEVTEVPPPAPEVPLT